MVPASREQFDHPAWRALGGTIVGYAVVLTIILLGLFVLPYLLYGAF